MRNWWHANVGGLPRTYWYLWFGMLLNKVCGFGVLYLSLYLVNKRGLDAAGAGLIVGLAGIGGALGSLTGGVLADRWGRRRTLLACNLATAAVMLSLAFTPWLAAIAVTVFLLGLFQSMAGPPMVAAIVDVVPEADRQRAFNLQFWAFNLGMAAASLLAGLLAETSFVLLFCIEAAATFLTFLMFAFKVPETLPAETPHASAAGPRGRAEGLGTALTDRSYMVFVGLTLLVAIVFTQGSTILPLAMQEDGLSLSDYGKVTAFAGLLIVIGQLFVPKVIGGRPKAKVLAAATAFLAVGFTSVAFADSLPMFLAAAFVWTWGSMLAAPPNAEIIADLAPPLLRGRYQAVFYLTFPLAGFVAPALGGLSLQHLGDWHWVIIGVLAATAGTGHLAAGPARERRVRALRDAEKHASGVLAGSAG